MNVNELHTELSHPSEATTQSIGKIMNFFMTGKFQPCKDCALVKAKCEEATS